MLLAIRFALVVLGVAAVVTGVHAVRRPPERTWSETGAGPAVPGPLHSAAPANLLQLARRTTPFRIGSRPPSVRYGTPPVTAQPAAPAVPRPLLVLTGLVLGQEPAAILEGIPGQEGAVVVRPGDVRGPLRIVSVDSHRVVIRGLDTAWSLQVRQPWH